MHVENNFVSNDIINIQDLGLILSLFTPSFQAEVNGVARKAMKLLWHIDTKLHVKYSVF